MQTGENRQNNITTEPKTFHFDLLINADKNLKHEIDSHLKHELLAEHTIINKIRQLLSKCEHENDIHEHRKQ